MLQTESRRDPRSSPSPSPATGPREPEDRPRPFPRLPYPTPATRLGEFICTPWVPRSRRTRRGICLRQMTTWNRTCFPRSLRQPVPVTRHGDRLVAVACFTASSGPESLGSRKSCRDSRARDGSFQEATARHLWDQQVLCPAPSPLDGDLPPKPPPPPRETPGSFPGGPCVAVQFVDCTRHQLKGKEEVPWARLGLAGEGALFCSHKGLSFS